MASVHVVLFTSKLLKNGEHPIMVRIIKDGKPKYISLSESCTVELWDRQRELPTKKHPLFRELEIKIEKKKIEAKRLVNKLEDENQDFSMDEFDRKYRNLNKRTSVFAFIDQIVNDLIKIEKIGNANVYKNLKMVLRRFRNERDFAFSEIDNSFLKKFEQDFRQRGVSENSMSVYFRTLRAVYSKAIAEGFAKKESDPFLNFKPSKFGTKTRKRAISKEDIYKIEALNTEDGSRLRDAQNFFMFSYYCSGINMADVARLTWENINSKDYLHYTRMKTNKFYSIKLHEKAIVILNYYRPFSQGNYIFPFLDKDRHKTALTINNRIKKVTKQVNEDLKILGEMAKIETPLTTYVARHTFATVLKRGGMAVGKISELMGHDSEQTTQIYLDSFDNEELFAETMNLL